MLYSLSLWIKRLWSTRSKALEKSKNNEPVILFSLIALNQSSIILVNAVWQEWCVVFQIEPNNCMTVIELFVD